jgi:hypothetical protein
MQRLTPLHRAAQKGDLAETQALLRKVIRPLYPRQQHCVFSSSRFSHIVQSALLPESMPWMTGGEDLNSVSVAREPIQQ